MVEESVEDGGGDDGVAEDVSPLSDAAVAGEEHGAALVAAGDELEEEVCGVLLQGEVPIAIRR